MCRQVLISIRIQISISEQLLIYIFIGFVTMLLLFYGFFLGGGVGHEASGILAPRSGVGPTPLRWKATSSPLGLQRRPSKCFLIYGFTEQANEVAKAHSSFLRKQVNNSELGDCGGV